MEQEGSLIGRLPFFTEKGEQKRTNMMPHPLHRTELGACRACRQLLPLPCFLTKQTQESCSLTACRAPLEKEPFDSSLNTVCLPLSGMQREDWAALRSVSTWFVSGPFIFHHCACKGRVKLKYKTFSSKPEHVGMIPTRLHSHKLYVGLK